MYYHRKLSEHVEEMREFGEFLMPYNFPKVPTEEEEDINFVKSREICVDGYTLIVHYNKGDYTDYHLETLQVLGKYSPFLPFGLVCKLGKSFLGDQHLSLVEIFSNNHKIYCWTLMKVDDKPIPGPHKHDVEHCVFEGFEYDYMSPKQVNFY